MKSKLFSLLKLTILYRKPPRDGNDCRCNNHLSGSKMEIGAEVRKKKEIYAFPI